MTKPYSEYLRTRVVAKSPCREFGKGSSSCGFVLIELRNFRDELGAQFARLFIVAAFQIGHACRETIAGGLDRRHGIAIIDLPGGIDGRRPENIRLGNLTCHWFILLQFPTAYGRHLILTYITTIVK
jgi:hypothetical protein